MFDQLATAIADNRHSIGEIVGFVAGFVVLCAGLPPLIQQLTTPRAGTHRERQGVLFLAVGNLLWVIAAMFVGSVAMCVMAALNTAIRLEVWRRSINELRSVRDGAAKHDGAVQGLAGQYPLFRVSVLDQCECGNHEPICFDLIVTRAECDKCGNLAFASPASLHFVDSKKINPID